MRRGAPASMERDETQDGGAESRPIAERVRRSLHRYTAAEQRVARALLLSSEQGSAPPAKEEDLIIGGDRVIPIVALLLGLGAANGSLELALTSRHFALVSDPLVTVADVFAPGGSDWGVMNWSDPAVDSAVTAIDVRSTLVRMSSGR